jgi:MFS family permease
MGDTLSALRLVWQNEAVRRAQLALAGSTIGDWSYSVAISVLVFQRAGATWVGIAQVCRLLPAALAAPFLGSIVDRFPRQRVLLATDAARAGLMSVIVVLAWTGAPLPVIVILMAATAIVATLFWPAQRAMLPSLVVEAEELTSANVVSSTVESIGSIIGPALGGLALAVFGVTPAFLIPIVAYGLSALAITRVHPPEQAAGEPVGDGGEDSNADHADEHAGMLAGIAAIVRTGDLRVLVGLVSAQVVVAGALNVLTVVVALQLLHGGDSDVGLLLGATGVGGLLGAVPALALSQRVRLTTTFSIGLVVWGAPIAVLAIAPSTGLALVLFAFVGAGNTLVDVSGISLLQRATPDKLLGRVFGVLESVIIGSAAVGALTVPVLLRFTTVRFTLVAVGALLPVSAALLWQRLRHLDAPAPDARLVELVRGDPIFAPLPQAVIERLAAVLEPVTIAAGETLFRAGDEGDRYYLVDSGAMRIEPPGQPSLVVGAGAGFGEIALIRRVPRQATLVAVEDSRLLALRGDEFVSAVTGHAASAAVADAVISSHLPSLRTTLGAA